MREKQKKMIGGSIVITLLVIVVLVIILAPKPTPDKPNLCISEEGELHECKTSCETDCQPSSCGCISEEETCSIGINMSCSANMTCLPENTKPCECQNGECVELKINCEKDEDCFDYPYCIGDEKGHPSECIDNVCEINFYKEACFEKCGAECGLDKQCSEGQCDDCTCKTNCSITDTTGCDRTCVTKDDCKCGCCGCISEDAKCEFGNVPCECAECDCVDGLCVEAEVECVEDEDCFYCNGVKSPGYACMNGSCEHTDSLHCDKECGAECETDEDCDGNACVHDECKCVGPLTGGVELKTEKKSYTLWEIVEITLSNDLNQNICYYAPGGSNCNKHAFTVQWLFNDEWQNLTTFQKGVTCSDVKEDFFCVDVPAKEEKKLSWDQTFYYKRKDDPYYQAPEGTYRVLMTYRVGEGEWEKVFSDNFERTYD